MSNVDELKYIDLLAKCLSEGSDCEVDRNGAKVRKIFGHQMRFDISNDVIPVLTTKKVFTRGITTELVFFIKGLTNNQYLEDRGVKIWELWKNASGDLPNTYGKQWRRTEVVNPFLNYGWIEARRHLHASHNTCHIDVSSSDQVSLTTDLDCRLYELWMQVVGQDRAYVYHPSWGSFDQFKRDVCNLPYYTSWVCSATADRYVLSPEYYGCCQQGPDTSIFMPKDMVLMYRQYHAAGDHGVYAPQLVIDQLTMLIDGIVNRPNDRRHVMSAWNVGDLATCALPPCHAMFQVFVDGDYISGQLYQRSADLFLGVPFNIVQYSMLLHYIAAITGKTAKEFIWTGGDCHIYHDQIASVQQQLSRRDGTQAFPTLRYLGDRHFNPTDLKPEDFEVVGYQSLSTITAPVTA
ncbi:thymidylate synthase [Candidatus Dojkabacteria bacterium]|uniref:Thymidylate synthase n=1 Tax=Candidatus Dojkabacteria bacterium TaxID=2099670 RepID=A0A5C7J2K7_9BACT|nr:MAG: thymidylate synthase [Candidatus Dojkabacteria bacterium]